MIRCIIAPLGRYYRAIKKTQLKQLKKIIGEQGENDPEILWILLGAVGMA